VKDLYICSYTPALSALIRYRQMMMKRIPPSFVAIGQGQTGTGKGKALQSSFGPGTERHLDAKLRQRQITSNKLFLTNDWQICLASDDFEILTLLTTYLGPPFAEC
jgi:hypothetical protein